MLEVLAVPAFADNYLWLIHDGTYATVVDPGDAIPILAALDTYQLSLTAILLTHHHADHVGGVSTLKKHFQVPVFGPRNEVIPEVTHTATEDDQITIPELSLHFSILDVPGHTRGHIAYVARHQNWLFCGDTLFAGGCGRLFEGTPAQMFASLAKLAALPETMQVYCAHEYTLANLRFALEIEPDNPALIARMHTEQMKRAHYQPTIPSSIGLEKATNPFLRCTEEKIINRLIDYGHIKSREPITVFTAIRQWKNSYR